MSIPSQSFVLAAKEKRERLRTTGPASSHAEDYISLSLTKHNDEYLGPHPESRLMREDDDLGQGDDGVIARINCLSLDLTLAPPDFAEYTSAKTRIALGKKARKAEADKVREEMQDLIADAFVYIVPPPNSLLTFPPERMLMKRRRNGNMLNLSEAVCGQMTIYPLPLRHLSTKQRQVRGSIVLDLRACSDQKLVPPPTEVPSLESSVTRISQTLASMTVSHAQNTASVSALSVENDQLDGRETELREIIARTEEKRRWFADFRDWLENVAIFLDEKVRLNIILVFLLLISRTLVSTIGTTGRRACLHSERTSRHDPFTTAGGERRRPFIVFTFPSYRPSGGTRGLGRNGTRRPSIQGHTR